MKITKKHFGRHNIMFAACVLFGLVASFCFAIFLYYNKATRQTVQSERANYNREIADQLSRNIDNLQDSYANEVIEGASVLTFFKPETKADLRKLYADRDDAKHFFITEEGDMFDLTGKVYTLSDEFFPTKIMQSANADVLMTYTSINFSQDYILFGKKTIPFAIDGKQVVGFAVGASSEQFSRNMTVSLFDGIGAGYLIDRNGAIIIKPKDNSLVFSGFNLFNAMKAGGATDAQINEIRDGMDKENSSFTVKVNKMDWMINCSKTNYNNRIIVAVPLTITASDTYRNMRLTVVFAFLFISALAAILGIVFLFSFRRQREEDRKAAATAAQTTFLAKMSHDIRTPLSAVIGMLELASDQKRSIEEMHMFASKAKESASYLLELINDMLDLQKITSGKMQTAHEPFSLPFVLDGIYSMYKHVFVEKGLDFSVISVDRFDTGYIGDAVKLKQILMNLLSNAMKFTPRGGKVSLTASHTPMDGGRDKVVLIVSDTGIGMSGEFLQRIFRPFEQEKVSTTSPYVGTGLGLNIVKTLTELMGGSVSVESTVNKGSRFTIHLPLERSQQKVIIPEENARTTIVPFNHQRVLLAEDNATNQMIAVRLLQEYLNLTVQAVNDGKQAVEAMQQSSTGFYAAILMDVQMPVMDGLEAAKAIRALNHPEAKTIPILALSANTADDDIRKSKEAGMNAHLSKPININELATTLHIYIKGNDRGKTE